MSMANEQEPQASMNPFNTRLRYTALTSHILLIAWMLLWYLVFPMQADYSLSFILFMYIMPLVLPLPGIIKGKPYTHAWASFIVLLYFLHAITVMYSVPEQILFASIEFVLAIVMFVSCSMFARYRGQELGLGLKKLKDVMEQERQQFEGDK